MSEPYFPFDETPDQYAKCRHCGSRVTHLRADHRVLQIWHCHSCHKHWTVGESLNPLDLAYELENLGECQVSDWDLGPFGY